MIARRKWGSTGLDVTYLGQGTWQMEGDDRRACVAALQAGLDLGLTHVDTAELYGRGRVEELVAEAIAGRRDEVFLVSKVMPSNASRRGTIEACERSLSRLKTDRLDGYLLHWPGPHALEDTIAAFERLQADGKIRSWGVSNFDVDDLKAAIRIAGEGRVACNQVLYHLEERAIEHDVLPFCVAHGIALVGYSPFGSGRFPSRNATLQRIAKAHGATPFQIALAFLTRHPATFAIPKAADAAHVRDNAAAASITLSDDDVRALDQAFPLGPRRALPTL
jgi:diketogulonate reductase-like aldo/keto reductase